jgi:hypothetical protein
MDKILLQGKLYITTHRLCFYSSFNPYPSRAFFGGLFIQIPIKDIVSLEKRKNGIFFDNSIAVTTVKGEMLLTSFLKRNAAYMLILNLTGIKNEPDGSAEECEGPDE